VAREELTLIFSCSNTATSLVGYLKETFLNSMLNPYPFSQSVGCSFEIEIVSSSVDGRIFRIRFAAAKAEAMSKM
jgi:hypothetical protein